MTTRKIIWTPTTKEHKICDALATTYAFNLKLCHKLFGYQLELSMRLKGHFSTKSCANRLKGPDMPTPMLGNQGEHIAVKLNLHQRN